MGRSGLVFIVAIALGGCGQINPPPSAASGTRSQSPSSFVTPTSTDQVIGAPTLATVQCKLPVTSHGTFDKRAGATGLGSDLGFLSIPAAALSRVADDEVAWADGVGYYTLRQPGLRSSSLDEPATWDPTLARWVPVAPALVAPDGLSYAWTEIPQTAGASSRIHKVDVATGRDIIVLSQSSLVAVSYQADAIYLVKGLAGEAGFHSSTGLWRLDLATLELRALAPESSGYWGESGLGDYISPGAAWRSELDPSDPAPQGRANGGSSLDRLVRLDLTTGATSVWFTRHGSEVAMVGVDQGGHALVAVHSAQTTEWWSLDGPETGTLVYRGPFTADGLGPYDNGTSGGYRPHGLMVDSNGLWISASPSGQLQLLLFASGHLETLPSLGMDDSVHVWYPGGPCSDS